MKLIFPSHDRSRPRLLLVLRDLPAPNASGAGEYRLSLVTSLARHFELFIVVLGYRGCRVPQSIAPEWAMATVIMCEDMGVDFPVWSSAATPDEAQFVEAWAAHIRPDLLLVDRVWLAPVVTVRVRRMCGISALLTHNVQYQRLLDFGRLGVNPNNKDGSHPCPGWTREAEAACLARVDVIIAISRRDQRVFREMAPAAVVEYVPFAHDVVSGGATLAENRGSCLFVGSSSPANELSLNWFLDETWPRVRKLVPQATLSVVGGVRERLSPERLERCEGVSFSGRVPALAHAYAGAEVCVVPLIAGGGLKIKLVEALCHGKACVSTSVGLQGVEELEDHGVIRADTAGDFAAAVARLLGDGLVRRDFARRNAEYARCHFSVERVYGAFAARMKTLIAGRSARTRTNNISMAHASIS